MFSAKEPMLARKSVRMSTFLLLMILPIFISPAAFAGIAPAKVTNRLFIKQISADKIWVARREGTSEDQAIRKAQRVMPGKILGVKHDVSRGVYQVKILSSNAKVKIVKIKKATGEIIQ